MKHTSSCNSGNNLPSTNCFRGVLAGVDQFLKTINPRTPEHAVLRFLRENAVGPKNAKCWKEIQAYLRKQGHSGYKKRIFQTSWLQFCRRNDCFIASYNKGYYLPVKPEDFIPYEIATRKRIRGEQANLRYAMTLQRLQSECAVAKKAKRTNTRSSEKRTRAERPSINRAPRKARSKVSRPTRS